VKQPWACAIVYQESGVPKKTRTAPTLSAQKATEPEPSAQDLANYVTTEEAATLLGGKRRERATPAIDRQAKRNQKGALLACLCSVY
jgi:hypothetical protein